MNLGEQTPEKRPPEKNRQEKRPPEKNRLGIKMTQKLGRQTYFRPTSQKQWITKIRTEVLT